MSDLGRFGGRATTTTDPPSGDTVALRVVRRNGIWYVDDCATTRFGQGATLRRALLDYCDDLELLTKVEGPFGPPIDVEVKYAKEVFDV